MRRRIYAVHAGLLLVALSGLLAVLGAPLATESLVGTSLLTVVLLIRHIAVRTRSSAGYGDNSASTWSTDTAHTTWVNDIFWWTAAGTAHEAQGSDDHDRKHGADSESSGGFFSNLFGGDSSSSDSGGSSESGGSSDYSSSDGGSSDSGSSSSSFD